MALFNFDKSNSRQTKPPPSNEGRRFNYLLLLVFSANLYGLHTGLLSVEGAEGACHAKLWRSGARWHSFIR